MNTVGSLFPIVLPSNFPTKGDLAEVHAQKGTEHYHIQVEQKRNNEVRRDYEFEIYLKKVHENQIRMEIFQCNTIDFYV